ncbi:VOC family protein [Streptomyces sp. NPDC058045]|uniref:VOC family protein n=1 Tax=Streptomyces sp. NPDC058045 TaxID=3346311 RepID=UPI0036F02A7A
MNEDMTRTAAARSTSTEAVFGAPCWVSLMARDLRSAHGFYGAVLGWEFRRGHLGEEFSVAYSDGFPVAGIGALAPALRVAVAWTPYFAVTDADETASRVRERSGTIAVGPLPFTTGRGALAADRDGAVFGIWEGRLLAQWELWRVHARVWVGLRTRDAFEAAIFYGEVLDWASGIPGCCEVSYVDEEVVLLSGGHAVARLRSGAVESAPDPAVRPRWQVHFRVPDVSVCVAAALRHGGSVAVPQAPAGQEGDDQATLRDPDGGLFTVSSGSDPVIGDGG